MKKYKIYIHKNIIDGKVYIGQTCESNLNKRFRNGQGYKGSPHFYNAIQEYGWENFEHFILEDNLTSEEADIRERYWIAVFDARNADKGYNLRSGGKGKPREHNVSTTNCRSVICKETGQIFSSLVEAALYGGLSPKSTSNITAQINGTKLSAGKHPITGEPLHWCYHTEDLENTVIKKRSKVGAKPVKNLETGEVFDSVNEAAKAYNICNITISKSCKSGGKIAVGPNKKQKYHWIFMN